VSANVENKFGPIHTYADVTGCGAGAYRCFTGPGGAYMDTSAVGFGPLGNFYRCSVSWNNVEDELLDYDNGAVSGVVIQAMLFPSLSSLSAINPALEPSAGGHVGVAVSSGDRWDVAGQDTRPSTYLSHFQFEYNPSAMPHQYIHGERPYYVTNKQDFVVIPKSYTTRLVDNTVNVRLYLDEELANGNTLREIGLFIKNPNGGLIEDNPYLAAYKALAEPINKENDFSYVIDWELSVVDVDSD